MEFDPQQLEHKEFPLIRRRRQIWVLFGMPFHVSFFWFENVFQFLRLFCFPFVIHEFNPIFQVKNLILMILDMIRISNWIPICRELLRNRRIEKVKGEPNHSYKNKGQQYKYNANRHYYIYNHK